MKINEYENLNKEDKMDFEIIYEDDTQCVEVEAFNKGYRKDVKVKVGDKEYSVYITSMLRLKQDFELEQQDYGYYQVEPNMIIVKEVTKEEIEYTISRLYKCQFFMRLDNNGF